MAAEYPDALTDPVGVVVELITGIEPALQRDAVAEVVRTVAAGRAKRRRLAQTLVDRPTLLSDGRSPAPRVAGELLIGLRRAGAVHISPPCCAECGKQLRTLQRRGDDWYCGVCGPKPKTCAACGNTRKVTAVDRQGQPRCGSCPPDDGHEPIEIVIEVVATVDPTIPAATVADAVAAVTSRAGQRRQLAWALQDRPELLTGAGAQARVPTVLRLIDELCAAGATGIVRPACPGCGRVIRLTKARGGMRLCRNCIAKSRAVACGRCGTIRDPATRDEHGRPLCPNCLISDPVNQETCVGCGRRRPVRVRGPNGPLCENCRPKKTMTCSICGRCAPCEISQVTGEPWCRACKQRWARCTRCAQMRPVRGGSLDQPLCATCTRPDPAFWKTCPTCGEGTKLRAGPCSRCALGQRLRELLTDNTEIRPELQGLYDNLVTAERPASVLRWLANSDAPFVLGELATGERPLTHDALDELGASKPIKHLRAILVATGALPVRDEHLVQLEHWVTRTIAERANPDEQRLLHHYAVWHLLRRLRGRNNGNETTHGQAAVVQQHVRAALTVFDWLAERDLTLATCGQGDLDSWLASDDSTHRHEAGHFLRWANTQKLTRLELPAVRWGGPTGVIDTEGRWKQARRLLRDDTLKPEDRVAGLLVLLYAQRAAAISRLTLDHITTDGEQTRLRLGDEPVILPEPLATLVGQLIASRRGHAVLGDPGNSPWLFPGGQPGRPISPDRLAERLRQIGLRPAQDRSTALFQLATDLPAALLARLLGIHISVAVQWQRASSGDWTNYAADLGRRTNPQTNTMHRDQDPVANDTHSTCQDTTTRDGSAR